MGEYRICSACVMDTTDPDIEFDTDGVCIHCQRSVSELARVRFSEVEANRRLEAIAAGLRARGRGREYDSILGLSGGVDSSYVAYLAGKLGLRPLVVHFDNGWNSELAVSNIKRICDKLGYDLYTYVIDWGEFRDLQRSFFRASVVDIEMLTDHAITAAMFRTARRHRIRHVLSGTNLATESGMPVSWAWRKQDLRNIRSIQKRYGTRRLKSFPTLSTWRYLLVKRLGVGLEYVEPLNNMNYRKDRALETLEREFGWRYYGGKHYESVFTKFYQAYVLPRKFGIDKRRAHLSALIRNGELTRAEALEELTTPPYSPEDLTTDRRYVLKKLGFTEEEFEAMMDEPPRCHTEYGSDEWLMRILRSGKRLVFGSPRRVGSPASVHAEREHEGVAQ